MAFGSLALLTKGLPEYEARVAGNDASLCLTLLRCVGVISKPDGALVTRPRTAGPQVSTPEGQCLGEHRFEYALQPGGHELSDAALLRESQDYRHGFLTTARPVALERTWRSRATSCSPCLKGAEDGDGLILRCFNPSGASASARIHGRVSVSRTRLDETGEEPVSDGSFELGAGQIATLRIRRSPDPAQA